jgi:CheY-like chemotaxis protein
VPNERDILFKGFSGEERSAFLEMGAERPFEAGEVLLAPGQNESRLALLLDGLVGVWAARTRLATLGPGDTMGTEAIIEPAASTVLLRAETAGTALAFPRTQVLDYFRSRPERLFHQFCVNVFSIWVVVLESRNRRIFELKSALTPPDGNRGGRLRVLIVDDECTIREAFGELLQDAYDILQARDGEEAIRIALSERPDLILLDLRMPGIDGYQVCRRLKGDVATSHIPVLVVTALATTQDKVKGLLHGADDYLIKPVGAEDLREKVGQILKRFETVLGTRAAGGGA